MKTKTRLICPVARLLPWVGKHTRDGKQAR